MHYLPLRSILTADVATVGPETPVAEALAYLEKLRISCVVAVDSAKRPIGIFTEQDVIALLSRDHAAHSVCIADALANLPLTAPLAMDYREAYQLMTSKGYRHLIVVDDAGILAGIISEGDFMQHLGMEYMVEHKPVRTIMTADVTVIGEEATLAQALTLMSRNRANCILITREHIPVGIVTERDMVRLAHAETDVAATPIASVMSSPVQTVAADCFIQDAVQRMRRLSIRNLAVVNEKHELVGLVTRHNIVKRLQGRYIEFLHESIATKNQELEHKQQQVDLLEKKLLYKNLMEQVDDAIFIADEATASMVDANLSACRWLGYSREELLKRNLQEVAPAIFDMSALSSTLTAQDHLTLQATQRCRDGSEFPIEIKLRRITYGNHKYLVAIARDQSLWHQQNRELHLLREALQTSATAVVITDIDAVIQWTNAAFCALTGYAPEESVGRLIKDLTRSGQQDQAFYQHLWQTILNGQVWRGELINKRKDGTRYTEEMTITPVYGEQATIEYFIAVKQNVTERKQMEKRLIENERFLNTIIESEPECVKLLDQHNRLLRMNRSGLAMIEAESDKQMLGQSVLDLVTPEYRDAFAELTSRTYAGESGELEFELHGLQGTHRWLATHSVPLHGANGEITAALSITRDITAQKQAEARILKLNRVYTMLSNINQAIVRVRDPIAMLQHACRIAVDDGGFRLAWVGLPDNLRSGYLYPVAHAGLCDALLSDFQTSLDRQICNPFVQAFHEGHYVSCCDGEQRQNLLSFGFRAFIVLPLKIKGSVRGVFALYTDQEDFFTDEEITLLDELAEDIAFGMEVAENDAERTRAEAHLRQAAAVFESTREGVMVTGVDKSIQMVNRAFTELTGYTEAEVLGNTPRLLQSGRHNQDFYAVMWQNINVTGHWQGEIWNRRKNGEVYPELLSISTVVNQQGNISGYVGVFSDISKLKASEAQLEFLARHDPLTRLPNRLVLLSTLEHAILLARREGRLLALLMLDLDRFKDVNDSFGHLAGDELLQLVAERLTTRLRAADTVCRLGGDEFTVLLENLNRAEDAARVAAAIIADLSEPWRLSHGGEVRIGVSVGISLFPQHGDSGSTLLQHADAALYQAKAEGRSRFKYFSEELTHAARERIDLEARLRRAIADEGLRVYFQPRIDIVSGRIVGAEALLRWYDPKNGLIMPERFIPVAETTGQISALGEWVLLETCRQGRRWIDAGMPPLIMAVNVSPMQLLTSDFSARVAEILNLTGFPAQNLELELTESTLMDREQEVMDKLNLLRSIGVSIAIDDFGTGYSSLAYLRQLPLDLLKIDRAFISDIPGSREDMQIASAIVGMAHTLRFKVLAEGVETQEQLDFLKAEGCDYYQGFLKSPAVPADEFEALLQADLQPS